MAVMGIMKPIMVQLNRGRRSWPVEDRMIYEVYAA
jgi:hypothetical protein